MGAMVLRNYGEGVTGDEWDPYAPDPSIAANEVANAQAAYYKQMGIDPNDPANQPHLVNYGEGVTGYEGGIQFGGGAGFLSAQNETLGNMEWNPATGQWIPIRDANDGSLFSNFIGGIAPFAALVGGGALLSGLGGAGAGALSEGFGGAGILGDSAMWGLEGASGLGAGAWGAADAANTYGTFESMGSEAMDFSNLGDLWNYGSEAGGSSLSDLSTAADQFGWSDVASPGTSIGANADVAGSSWFNTLIEQAKANPFSTAAKVVKSVLGGTSGNSTGSNAGLLSGLAKLYSAYNSEGNLKDAIGQGQGYLDRAVNWSDPNQPRGDTANRLWTENYTNPKAGYNEFMTGAGREFTEQARAAAAKSGKRGSYLNSGKMQSDLASLWMKNQFSRGDSLAKGFTNPRNYAMDALRDSMGLSDLYKQKGGSIGMAVGDLLGSSQARELISNITGSYW